MATRTTVINDPVGIHARPAAQFSQAVTASGCTVTIAKEGGNPVPAGSILSIMGLGIKQGVFRGHRRAGRRRRNRGRQPAEHPRQRRVIFFY